MVDAGRGTGRSTGRQLAGRCCSCWSAGLLEAGGLVPGSRLGGIRVVLLGDQVPVEVLAVDGQALEGLTLIAGGQRVGGDAGLLDPGKALVQVGAVHRVVRAPSGLGSVDQQIPGHEGPFVLVGAHTVPIGWRYTSHEVAATEPSRMAAARRAWEAAVGKVAGQAGLRPEPGTLVMPTVSGRPGCRGTSARPRTHRTGQLVRAQRQNEVPAGAVNQRSWMSFIPQARSPRNQRGWRVPTRYSRPAGADRMHQSSGVHPRAHGV